MRARIQTCRVCQTIFETIGTNHTNDGTCPRHDKEEVLSTKQKFVATAHRTQVFELTITADSQAKAEKEAERLVQSGEFFQNSDETGFHELVFEVEPAEYEGEDEE